MKHVRDKDSSLPSRFSYIISEGEEFNALCRIAKEEFPCTRDGLWSRSFGAGWSIHTKFLGSPYCGGQRWGCRGSEMDKKGTELAHTGRIIRGVV